MSGHIPQQVRHSRNARHRETATHIRVLAIGWVVFDVSKNRRAFVFNGRRTQEKPDTAPHPSRVKSCEMLAWRHNHVTCTISRTSPRSTRYHSRKRNVQQFRLPLKVASTNFSYRNNYESSRQFHCSAVWQHYLLWTTQDTSVWPFWFLHLSPCL